MMSKIIGDYKVNMSVLEIALYITLGLAVATYIGITIYKMKHPKKKKKENSEDDNEEREETEE